MEKKRCSTCCYFLPLSEFAVDKNGKPKSRCKICNSDRTRNYKVTNPIRHKEIHRKSQLKRKYGITLEDYNKLFIIQEGKCAICGTHQTSLKQGLVVDHDHSTGDIRGLLCSKCNLAIGLFNDNPDILYNASMYIKGINNR